ncbi:hypothetical protein CTAYLR_010255 [Chrysophaeum taylorii]|uniref:STAS domain-containing protein n=1 Tax=Chrysophaeum taylorii TaxID=2483200 RepID=A0AAD7UJZ4_9STRA|nr:hypothetical protein CTAYLR_010255 [Chrysophaeum taylorii]
MDRYRGLRYSLSERGRLGRVRSNVGSVSVQSALFRLERMSPSEMPSTPDLSQLGLGECLNFVEASRPSEAFLQLFEEGSEETEETPEVVVLEEEEDAEAFGEGGPPKAIERALMRFRGFQNKVIDWNACGRQLIVDLVASGVTFFLTSVIYVSGGQSVFGRYFEGKLVFVAVEAMFAGTAITGIALPCLSSVPWAVAAVDVGFLPLLAHCAEIVYHGVVVDSDSDLDDDSENMRACFCVGVSLWTLGALELTRLSNYLPYPVIAGLLASIGVSLAKSGISVAAKGASSRVFEAVWIGAAVGLAGVSMYLKRRLRVAAHVATPIVVAIGVLALFGASAATGIPRSQLGDYGALFAWDDAATAGWWAWKDDYFCSKGGLLVASARLDVVARCRAVFVAACVIGALKIGIKCGSFAAMFMTSDVDADAEMRLVGAANAVAALALASGQAHSFSGLKVGQQLNATHKLASLLVPAWYVFGSMLVELGIDYVETYLVYPLQQSRAGRSNLDVLDVATMISIVVAAVAFNLLEAIALGLVFSLIGVSRRLAQRSIVRSTRSGKDVRSTIERTPDLMRALDSVADAIFVVELVGYVFFGSAHELVDAVGIRVKSKKPLYFVVVDISGCLPTFDVTAVAAFEKIFALARARDFKVFFAPTDSEASQALDSAIQACGKAGILLADNGRFFESVDDALEAAEDSLLRSTGKHNLDRASIDEDDDEDGFAPTIEDDDDDLLLRTKGLFNDWLRSATERHGLVDDDEFLTTIARLLVISDTVDLDDDRGRKMMALLVDGRVRLLNDSGICVRKLAHGNALAVGDYYIQDDDMRRTYSPVPASARVLVLKIYYDHLLDLEKHKPHIALKFHKLMARSLAQKNRNSKLAHR